MLPESDIPHAIEDVVALIRASAPGLEHEACKLWASGYVVGLQRGTVDNLRNNIPNLIKNITKG